MCSESATVNIRRRQKFILGSISNALYWVHPMCLFSNASHVPGGTIMPLPDGWPVCLSRPY